MTQWILDWRILFTTNQPVRLRFGIFERLKRFRGFFENVIKTYEERGDFFL
jgi:hypothetical protein